MARTYKTSAPPTRKPRNSWPRDTAPTVTPRDPVDRIMARIERREVHASAKSARIERKRYALIAEIAKRQRLGTLPCTQRTPSELVQRMDDRKVDELYRKIVR